MSSMSKSNNFLLRNGQYNKDNVFDHFDINNLVSNDLKIPKTSLNNFLYYNGFDHDYCRFIYNKRMENT